jgi:hypothetical protein
MAWANWSERLVGLKEPLRANSDGEVHEIYNLLFFAERFYKAKEAQE